MEDRIYNNTFKRNDTIDSNHETKESSSSKDPVQKDGLLPSSNTGGIGGYMEFESYQGDEYYPNLVAINIARNSIRYLCKTKGYKKFYVPFYLGWSIFDLFHDDHIDYECYPLKMDMTPDFTKIMKKGECLLLVNFFGQLNNNRILEYKHYFRNILVDNTEAFFQEPVPEVDTFYTCHKYFGVPDGAYLYTDIRLEGLETDISYERFSYLTGRLEAGANAFYDKCRQADDNLRYLDLKSMSKLTHNILASMDYSRIENTRKKNFTYLNTRLSRFNEWKALITGTFMYPLLIKGGEGLREELIKNHIYIPRFWKNVMGTVSEDSFENYLVHNLLPIPMDHRYGLTEMEFIVSIVEKYLLF